VSPLPAGLARKIILLEFNELCPALLDRWMAEGELPNFTRLRRASHAFITEADVADPAMLEPWIQWYSIHSGLAYDQHRVFHLTDGPRAGFIDIYQALIGAGRTVGSVASMNVAPFAAPGSFYVGDPWTENGDASPLELNIYNRFISGQVREYSNARATARRVEQIGFVRFMLGHGLSLRTIVTIVNQLAKEKVNDPRLSYRRVAILDRLQADVFRSLYGRTNPDFASFFLNSTAHLQHSYWRHLDPDAFLLKPKESEMPIFGDAIRFGYRAMDRLVGEFLKLADRHGATLIFMTALSQQPFTRYEEQGGQHFYRLYDVEGFLDGLEITRVSVDPTMTHQYMVRFSDIASCDSARTRLAALHVESGRAMFGFPDRVESGTQLYFGCQIATPTPKEAIVIDDVALRRYKFGDLVYKMDAIKSGRHHPDGALWVRTGQYGAHDAKVSILDFFPTMIDVFGLPMPREAARRGQSLLPVLSLSAQREAA
jgi:hypothetical protein